MTSLQKSVGKKYLITDDLHVQSYMPSSKRHGGSRKSAKIVHQEQALFSLRHAQTHSFKADIPTTKLTAKTLAFLCLSWRIRAPGPKIYGEITKDSKTDRTCPRKGKAVLTPQVCFEELQEGTLACCLVFLGLLFSFFSSKLAALIPYSAGDNWPQEAQRPQAVSTLRNAGSHGAEQTRW